MHLRIRPKTPFLSSKIVYSLPAEQKEQKKCLSPILKVMISVSLMII